MVIIKETDEVATIRMLGANYVIVEDSMGKKFRKWIDAVELVEVRQDPDIADRKGTQPAKYHAGLSKSTKAARDRQFKKQTKMADNNPAAYKPAPGDKDAKTKPSVYTKKFKQMFGEKDAQDAAKKRIDREKQRVAVRHDRMMDRARMRDTIAKNRETNPNDKVR